MPEQKRKSNWMEEFKDEYGAKETMENVQKEDIFKKLYIKQRANLKYH
jgi:hypothetical protein